VDIAVVLVTSTCARWSAHTERRSFGTARIFNYRATLSQVVSSTGDAT
jgi:hypothetical protein